MDISFAGEARYHNSENNTRTLESIRKLIEQFGGTFSAIEENKLYRLGEEALSVQELQRVLTNNHYPVTLVSNAFGISDANNAPAQWHTVVFSDGSTNPHRSDESIR